MIMRSHDHTITRLCGCRVASGLASAESLDDKMLWQSVFKCGEPLAPDEGQKVADAVVRDLIAARGDEPVRDSTGLIGDPEDVLVTYFIGVRIVAGATDGHHRAADTGHGGGNGGGADIQRFVDVLRGQKVGGTALRQIEFDRTNLTAEPLLDRQLQRLAGSGKIPMSEHIDRAALGALSDIRAVRALQPLGDGNDDIRVLPKGGGDILIEGLIDERTFGEVG